MRELRFISGGVACAAWHLPAESDQLRGERGRPCVVIGPGFGATRDTALLPFAEGFADAGLHALLFDYRGFGSSAGIPRQRVSFLRQRADYRAAIVAARKIDGVDPARIVLWGTSYSGGHVVAVGADEPGVAAVISLTPAMDGLVALSQIARRGGPARLGRLLAVGLHDGLRNTLGLKPRLVPVVGAPGSRAAIAAEGAEAGYCAIAGPTWRNEICARSILGVGCNRPIRFAKRLRRPWLVQIGDRDSVAPPAVAHAAAALGDPYAEVRQYPVDHFDVYEGVWHRRVLDDQLQFLRRHLTTGATSTTEGVATT
jgi:pimeloyl-ACP methyl ester carboxylesterase